MAKKESEAKPPEQTPSPVVQSFGNAGTYRVDMGESPTQAPIKTATDSEK